MTTTAATNHQSKPSIIDDYWHCHSGLDSPLRIPHYSDDYWNTARFLYCKSDRIKKTDLKNGNYSDRLAQFDGAAHKRGNAAITGKGRLSAANIKIYLEAYHQQPIDLIAVLGGVNQSNGHEYYYYEYLIAKS